MQVSNNTKANLEALIAAFQNIDADALSASGMQIYWPYSEAWDGAAMPVITFDPESEALSNVGYEPLITPDGTVIASGEDADTVASQMGDALNSDNPFDTSGSPGGTAPASRPHPFTKDPPLYEM